MNKPIRYSGMHVVSALLLAALLLGSASIDICAQERRPIERPFELDTKKKINDFINQVLSDKTRRPDPFTRNEQLGVDQVTQYKVEEKPRPDFGLGKYDIENLVLRGLWRQDDEVVAVVSGPDGQSMVVRVGDEAYDGKVVEINMQERYIKFFQKLQRENPANPDAPPEIIFVEKIVSFRN